MSEHPAPPVVTGADAVGAGAVRVADRWRVVGMVLCGAWVALALVLVGWYVGIATSDDPMTDVHGYITVFGLGVIVLPALVGLGWALASLRMLVRRNPTAWVFHWVVGGVGLAFAALGQVVAVVALGAVTLVAAWLGSRSWRRAAGPPA